LLDEAGTFEEHESNSNGNDKERPMIAAALTLAAFGLVLTLVVDVMRRDGAKIVAALEGRSWTSDHSRPVTISFSRPDRAAAPDLRPELRAAA
jgi:hypothetical protein